MIRAIAFFAYPVSEMARPGARGGNVAFEVDDVDAFAARAAAAGATVVKEPFDAPVCRMADRRPGRKSRNLAPLQASLRPWH